MAIRSDLPVFLSSDCNVGNGENGGAYCASHLLVRRDRYAHVDDMDSPWVRCTPNLHDKTSNKLKSP
jgi:hypothetical protein